MMRDPHGFLRISDAALQVSNMEQTTIQVNRYTCPLILLEQFKSLCLWTFLLKGKS
jgi:hypothetical protein